MSGIARRTPIVPALLFVAAVVAAGCGGGASAKKCTVGASVACACPSGLMTAQVCGSDGTFEPCPCGDGTGAAGSTGSGGGGASSGGGSGGTGGAAAGGTSGSGSGGAAAGGTSGGGRGGTGAGGSSSGIGGQTQAQLTITYDGTSTSTLSTCLQCSAYYTAATSTAAGTYTFRAGTGITEVDIAVRPASAGGNEVSVEIDEGSSMLPTTQQGLYATTPVYLPAGNCVTLTAVQLGPGGGFIGSLDCTLSGGNDSTPHTARVKGSFTASVP